VNPSRESPRLLGERERVGHWPGQQEPAFTANYFVSPSPPGGHFQAARSIALGPTDCSANLRVADEGGAR
jgi:hypothetical protein